MNIFQKLPSPVCRLAWTFLLWFVCVTTAYAQNGGEEEEPKSYVLAYALVMACFSLGIFVVVRMGKRRNKKIKRLVDEEDWD